MKRLLTIPLIVLASAACAQYTTITTHEINNGKLGVSVDPVGDINNDGTQDYIAGAWLDNNSGATTNAGKAYVISGADQTIIRTLSPPSPQVNGWFGYSVASGIDLNSDGVVDFVIGAPGETATFVGAGRVHVFSGVNGNLLYTITSFSPTAGGQFGNAVLVQNDLDAIGGPEIVVAAYQEPGAGVPQGGRVHVYNRSNYRNTLLSPTEKERGGFGWRLAEASNFMGENVLLVSGIFESMGTSPANAGAVHAFNMTTAGNPLVTSLEDAEPKIFGNFGWSITSYADAQMGGTGVFILDGMWGGTALHSDGTPHATTILKGGSAASGNFNLNGTPDFASPAEILYDVSAYISPMGNIGGYGYFLYESGFGDAIATLPDDDGDGANEIVAFQSNGLGHFISGLASVPTGVERADYFVGNSTPQSGVISDLDGDGKKDLALSNPLFPTAALSVLRNTSTAATLSFAPLVDFTTAQFPAGTGAADFDGDSKMDIAVASNSGTSVSVFRNISSPGTIDFDPKLDFATAFSPWSVEIADLDADGKFDMIIGNHNTVNVSVFRNKSTGTGSIDFDPRLDLPSSGNYASSVDVADIDGDLKPDIIVVYPGFNVVSVLRNTTTTPGTITFAAAVDFSTSLYPLAITVADLNSDGKADIIAACQDGDVVSALRNTSSVGTVTFDAAVNYTTGDAPISVAAGDLYGNGKTDLVVVNTNSNSVSLLRNTSNPGGAIFFAAKQDYITPSNPRFVAVGNLDSDFLPDIAVTCAQKVAVLRNNIPAISSFTPTAAGNTVPVTITGANFTGATSVTFGGTAASFVVTSPTSITATVGVGTSGNIVVTTPHGTGTKSGFTWAPAPTISNFNPTSAASGTVVNITGTNLTGTTEVSFGGTPAASIGTVTATTIAATVGAGASGPVSVTAPGGTVSIAGFTYIPTPTITSFSPTSAGPGMTVTITGTDLGGATAVTFGGTAATTVTVVSSTSVTAVVATGTSGDVQVVTPGGTATLSGFTFVPTPTITSFDPASAGAGATVNIIGTNLSTATGVSFGGTAGTVSSATATTVAAVVGAGTTGSVQVVTLGGSAIATGFTFILAPTITSFNPPIAGAGATVTIIGTNFTAASTVKFGGTDATSVTFVSATEIRAVVGPGASGSVSVTSEGGTGSLPGFTHSPSPTIATFTPPGGPTGTLVEIRGTNFGTTAGSNTVKFNGTPALVSTNPTATVISATVPAGATTGKITVEVAGAPGESVTIFTVDNTEPVVTDKTQATITAGSAVPIVVSLADAESGIATAKIKYGSVSSGLSLTTADLTAPTSGSDYTFSVPAASVGELGLQYRFEVTNGVGTTKTTTLQSVNLVSGATGETITYGSFGIAEANYRIISIPLSLTSSAVSAVFDELMPYDDTKWRLFHYENGANRELNETSTLSTGFGYWLIIKSNATVSSGAGATVEASTDQPFSIQLKAGWNQIGNPYGFNISWADVQAANTGLPILRRYTGTFEDGSRLNKGEGGFVNVTADRTMVFPVAKNASVNGRVLEDEIPFLNDLTSENWQVYLQVDHGKSTNRVAGFGMNRHASDNRDALDGLTMPKFFGTWLELSHTKPLPDFAYTKDIVPTSANHEWEFTVSSSHDEDVMTFSWDNSYFGDNDKQLYLWDETAQRSIDMREFTSYSFNWRTTKKFKVIFGSHDFVNERVGVDGLVLHNAWPNPADDLLTIGISVPQALDRQPLKVEMVDLLGRKVWNEEMLANKGYREMSWRRRPEHGQGIYVISVSSGAQVRQVKVVLK